MTQANTPQPPYYAAIFSSTHTGNHEGYAEDTETILEPRQAATGLPGRRGDGRR